MPADPEYEKTCGAEGMRKKRPPDSKSIQEVSEEVLATTPDDVEPSLHIFQRLEGGLVMRMGTIRAHFKDCARVLSGYSGKLEGEKSFSVKILNSLYYPPEQYWVPILNQDSGKQMVEVSGQRDKPVHAWTPRGTISAIKVFEFVENARLEFVVQMLQTASGKDVVGRKDLEDLFEYGGVHGYGGERGDGEGRYLATLTPLEMK
jgi:hypothetical protein